MLEELDVTYAEGLAHDGTSDTPFAVPLKLDVYYPDATTTNRPVLMFIHGGGFTGGIKHNPDIVEMGKYYASRGWVFVSIDYRTTEELCDTEDKKMPLCKERVGGMLEEMLASILEEESEDEPHRLVEFYRGIAPDKWINFIVEQKPKKVKLLQQGIAQYTAQRDAKAALRWIVANASTYNINTDYISVGGASAGAATTIALGISNPDDFRDEISTDEDPTLATTNLDASYDVKSIISFWGTKAQMDLYEAAYKLEEHERYDSNDPELFMAHGTAPDPATPYEGSVELQAIYEPLGIYNELATIVLPNGEPAGHGAWNGQVDGKGLFELTFEFLVQRQGLRTNP